MAFYILIVAISAKIGISFSVRLLNVVSLVAALISTGMLATRLFRLDSRFLAICLGCLALFFCLLLALFLASIVLTSGNSAVTVALDGGLYCRETVYGFVTSDSGEELEIYRRYLFIDYRLYRQVRSDIHPDIPAPTPALLVDTVRQCQKKIDDRRSTPGREV